MLPEIVQKFKDDLALFGECIIERVQELLPDLSPEEQQDAPILMSETVFATVLFCPTLKYTTDEATYQGDGCVFKSDIALSNNHLSFNVGDYIGMTYDVSWAKDVSLENSNNSTIFFELAHAGDLSAALSGNGFEIKLYYDSAYHNTDIKFKIDAPVTNRKLNLYLASVKMGNEGITSFSVTNEIVSWTPARDIKPQSSGQVFYALKSYPFISNVKDTNNINNWVSNNGATNNYTTTYTTPNNKTITVYYGDNYIITHVNNDDPVSYNDIKNAVDIAVNQINDDNDTDIPHIPDYPIPPPPSPIESDNQEDGGNYEHAKFTKVYACTNSELENLYNWMGGGAAGSSGTSPITVPNNFDPMERIVGLIGYPMEVPTSQTDETTFTFRNAANQTINTGWSTYKFWQMHNVIDFGTVDIPHWEDEANGVPFLDYSSTVEIYVPFCGVVGLDPQSVMGCTLSCKMYIDFMTGDCSAIVYTNYGGADSQHPVAFLSGNCGSAEVVSANAFGALQGAKAYASHKMSQAIIGGVKNLATSIIGGATTGFTRGAANPSGTGGSAGMKAGAIGSVIGGAMDLGVNLTLQNMDNQYAVQVAKNSLGTTISGDFGQSTSWHYMDKPYIKVTWPTPISKNVELYGKTYGVPVHKSGTLSEYTGYTICNNVDVSGISGATASELATIKQFLETGVYIKEGGEG